MSLPEFTPLTAEQHNKFVESYRALADESIRDLVLSILCKKYPLIFLDIYDSIEAEKELKLLFKQDKKEDLEEILENKYYEYVKINSGSTSISESVHGHT